MKEFFLKKEDEAKNHGNAEMYGNLRLFCLTFISPTHTIILLFTSEVFGFMAQKTENECFLITIMCVCFIYCEDVYFYAHCRNPIFRS